MGPMVGWSSGSRRRDDRRAKSAREVTLAVGYGQRRGAAVAVLILIGGTLLLALGFIDVGI